MLTIGALLWLRIDATEELIPEEYIKSIPKTVSVPARLVGVRPANCNSPLQVTLVGIANCTDDPEEYRKMKENEQLAH